MRRTARLAEAQRRIAFSAGGEAGARLASRLAMPVSGDTLLRLIRTAPLPTVPTPRVIGIDDWAWRRGQRYGTLIVDLERSRPIDVLPDRDAQTVGAWLNCHPGIDVVAHDRAGAYADGVRSGAPQAVQVADRWHLLRNLGDALARTLDRHHGDLRAAAATAVEAMQDTRPAPDVFSALTPRPPVSDRHAVRRDRFYDAMALHGQGWPARRIARAVGANRQTVQGWLRSGQLPIWRQQRRGSTVDHHTEYLEQRWNEGCHNAAQLWRELQEKGFRGQWPCRWAAHRMEPAVLDLLFWRIVKKSNDIVILTTADLDRQEIVYVNPAFTRLTGYSFAEVSGRSPRLLQGPGTSRATLDAIRRDLQNGREVQEKVLNYVKSGAPYWLDLRIFPLRDGDGTITHFAAIERDVTLDKRRLVCSGNQDGYGRRSGW